MREFSSLIIILLLFQFSSFAQNSARGTIYEDANGNGKKDRKEKGIPGVAISNGIEVVLTDNLGKYVLPVGNDNIIFVVKPSGYKFQPDSNFQTRFYYIHKPEGSPAGYKYAGVTPTGKLPASIDFGLTRNEEPENFTAFIFGDPQPYTAQELDYFSRGVVDSVSGIKNITFGISLGDIVGDDLNLHLEYLKVMRKAGIPWYNVMGNHDMNYEAKSDSLSDESFEAHFGPANYAFNYGKIHLIVMDDILYPDPRGRNGYWGGFTKTQLAFIENDLKHVSKDKLVIVSFHIPLMQYGDTYRLEDRQRLFDLLTPFQNALILSAHTHLQRNDFYTKADGWKGEKPLHEYNAATTSGDWYSGELNKDGIPYSTMRDGTPKGFALIHFNGNQYTIDYQVIGKPADYQLEIFAPKVIPDKLRWTTYKFYVNYFMGSPKDTLEYSIDGGKWSRMFPTEEASPDYLDLLHRWDFTPQLMPGRRPSNPEKSTHVWQVNCPNNLQVGKHVISVRVRDMFGRVFMGTEEFMVEEKK
ncbi:calcineurin-like phosphoesterase C-terminal domain-containing protein [Pollutibacter soli]|uniref:calcineurin-like phosphoesterase C-terminal domain-containing protein n=1 Tax=Pollutibacter soli TaxID=3034157 RepID=UPI00301377BB